MGNTKMSMENMNVLTLYDEATEKMRDVVPIEDVYSLLDLQKQEMLGIIKDSFQHQSEKCDDFVKEINTKIQQFKEQGIKQELVKIVEEGLE